MAFVYREGNVSAHTYDESEFPVALVFDRRDPSFNTLVVMDILTSLPAGYALPDDDSVEQQIPHPEWVCEAILSCHRNRDLLFDAWLRHKRSS